METWGFCSACDRWFYIERRHLADPMLSRCPVCATCPDSVSERTPARAGGVDA